jgi:hypothetical protein
MYISLDVDAFTAVIITCLLHYNMLLGLLQEDYPYSGKAAAIGAL